MASLYKHLGVAVAFSPRLKAILSEVAYRGSELANKVTLIHVGPHSDENDALLRREMLEAGIADDVEVAWVSGAPDAAILRSVETLDLDLLMAGALEKERPFRYFLGSVARNLVREAECSLILLTDPHIEPQPFRRIVLVAEYTDQALAALTKTIRLAEQEGADKIFVIRVLSEYGAAMLLSSGVRQERARSYQRAGREQEESLLRDFVDAAGRSGVPIDARCIEGETGYIAARFAREQEADLLVIPSMKEYSHFLERVFPSDMEWVLREIPCNLWVVRSRAVSR